MRPLCPACGCAARLMFGSDACPDRPELADEPVWACTLCDDTYAECWPGTESPMGGLADGGLREARALLLRRVEHICREEPHQALTRDRVRAFLASELAIDRAAVDIRFFTLEQCRSAWEALGGKTFADIRYWCATYRGPAKAQSELRPS